jgi:hypothetical protein
MKIKIYQKETLILDDKSIELKKINLGQDYIEAHPFVVIDNLLEVILPLIKKEESVSVDNDGLAGKMLARKIEDKIKREVVICS